MKIRLDFVTNSSSSVFILCTNSEEWNDQVTEDLVSQLVGLHPKGSLVRSLGEAMCNHLKLIAEKSTKQELLTHFSFDPEIVNFLTKADFSTCFYGEVNSGNGELSEAIANSDKIEISGEVAFFKGEK